MLGVRQRASRIGEHMRRVTAIVAVLCVLSGCSTVRYQYQASSSEALAELNGRLSTRDVTVVLRDGTRIRAEQATVRQDSTFVVVHGSPSTQPPPDVLPQVSFATADVAGIRANRPWRGALKGVGLGFVTGAALGATFGYFGDSKTDMLDRSGSTVLGGIVFGLLGTVVGVLVGAVAGHRELHELEHGFVAPADEVQMDSGSGQARPLPN
jgi:VIT1/CCC1 family predicted Fe2+/Mn2+ transporter